YATAKSNCEQPELTLASPEVRLPPPNGCPMEETTPAVVIWPHKSQHLLRLGAGQPLSLGHGLVPSPPSFSCRKKSKSAPRCACCTDCSYSHAYPRVALGRGCCCARRRSSSFSSTSSSSDRRSASRRMR